MTRPSNHLNDEGRYASGLPGREPKQLTASTERRPFARLTNETASRHTHRLDGTPNTLPARHARLALSSASPGVLLRAEIHGRVHPSPCPPARCTGGSARYRRPPRRRIAASKPSRWNRLHAAIGLPSRAECCQAPELLPGRFAGWRRCTSSASHDAALSDQSCPVEPGRSFGAGDSRCSVLARQPWGNASEQCRIGRGGGGDSY